MNTWSLESSDRGIYILITTDDTVSRRKLLVELNLLKQSSSRMAAPMKSS